MNCAHCGEPIGDERTHSQGMHVECVLRTIVGSVAHIQKRCGCYVPGSKESDPPHMTLRQAAVAACTEFCLQKTRN